MAMRTRQQRRGSSRKITVDFEGVGEGGGGFHIPEGEYGMRCEEVKKGVSSNDNEQIEWIFKGTEGNAKGKTFYFYTPIVDQALWKLRETLLGLSVEVPDSAMDIELDELEGLEGIGIVEDDEYRGKTRSKLVGFVVDENGGEPEPTTRKRNGKKLPKIAESEVKEMSEDELADLIEKYGLEKAVDLDEFKTLSKKRSAVVGALDEKGALE